MLSTVFALQALLVTPVRISAILTPETDLRTLIPLTRHSVDSSAATATVDGKTYHVVVNENSASLIDPEIYAASYVGNLLADLAKVQTALYRRDTDFSIAKSCPALVKLFLYTHSKNSISGIRAISLKPSVEMVLSLGETEAKLTLNEYLRPDMGRIEIKGQELEQLLSVRQSPFVSATMSFHVLSYLSVSDRKTVQEKTFERMWQLREELNQKYISLHDDIGARLVNLNPNQAPIAVNIGQPISKLGQEQVALILLKLSQQGYDQNEWVKAKLKSINTSLSLESTIITPEGKDQVNVFNLPPHLP